MAKQLNWMQRSANFAAIALVPTSLLAIAVTPAPANANAFQHCIKSMQRVQVAGDIAAIACSDAVRPKELGRCVRDLGKYTSIDLATAINGCYRVRRPEDLADCVVDINKHALLAIVPSSTTASTASESASVEAESESVIVETESETVIVETEPESVIVDVDFSENELMILDNCQQSLLPKRFADCVVGIHRQVPNSRLPQSLNTCISADTYPRIDFRDLPVDADLPVDEAEL